MQTDREGEGHDDFYNRQYPGLGSIRAFACMAPQFWNALLITTKKRPHVMRSIITLKIKQHKILPTPEHHLKEREKSENRERFCYKDIL